MDAQSLTFMSKGVFAVYPQQTQSNAGILALPSIIKNQTMVIRLKSAYGSAVGISSVPTTLLLATNPVPTRFYSYQSVGVQTNAGYTMVIVPQQIFSGVGSGSATLGALFHSQQATTFQIEYSSYVPNYLQFFLYSTQGGNSAPTMVTTSAYNICVSYEIYIQTVIPSPGPISPAPIPTPAPTPTPTPTPSPQRRLRLAKNNRTAIIPRNDDKGNMDFYAPENIVIQRGKRKFVSTGWTLVSHGDQFQVYVMPSNELNSMGLTAQGRIVQPMLPNPCPCQGLQIVLKNDETTNILGFQISNSTLQDIIIPVGSLLLKGVGWLASRFFGGFFSEFDNQDANVMIQQGKRPRNIDFDRQTEELKDSGPFKRLMK